MLYKLKKGRRIITALLLIPFQMTPVVSALGWRTFIYNPLYGLLNLFLGSIGLPKQRWLSDPSLVLPSIIIYDTWAWSPFIALSLLAGLMGIPIELFEAARIDGASEIKIIKLIIIPTLKSLIAVVALIRGADIIKAFATIFTMTGGGPGYLSEIINLYCYYVSFIDLKIGYGASIGIFSFILITLYYICILKVLIKGE
jgi:multiple sugar transport system permease protein